MKTVAQLTGRLIPATAATEGAAGITAHGTSRFASDDASVTETAAGSGDGAK